jgi:tripartite-type tricarboxylate transporter receptor subunit TctC
VQEALADPEILKAWAASGVEPYAKELQTPAGAAKYLHSEIERWGQVVRDNKIEAPGN